MSYFPKALILALEAARLSQAELAAQTKIGAVQINRYTRGRAEIGAGNLERILDVFAPAEQAKLVQAFLLDSIAERFRALVEIKTTLHAAVSEPSGVSYEFENLPEDFENALRFLASRAEEKTVRDVIEDLAALLRPRPAFNAAEAARQALLHRAAQGDLPPAKKATLPAHK